MPIDYIYMEDKEEIVKRLFRTLQICRAFKDLISLDYRKGDNGETVIATFEHHGNTGTTREMRFIDVTADSGCTLIEDVWKRLYELCG